MKSTVIDVQKAFGLSLQICFEDKELKRILNSTSERYEEKSSIFVIKATLSRREYR